MWGIYRGFLLFLALAVPSPALGDPVSEAKRHYEEGLRLDRAGKAREAIVELERAYSLKPHPAILFSVAEIYRVLAEDPKAKAAPRLADAEQARERYRRFAAAPGVTPENARLATVAASALETLQAHLAIVAAKEHYALGDEQAAQGHHREAIREYDRAYSFSPHPEILYNIGREYHALGDSGAEPDAQEIADMEEAVDYYRRYLEKKKSPPNLFDVEEAIRSLEQKITAARAPRPAAPPAVHLKPPMTPPVAATVPVTRGEKRRRLGLEIGLGVGVGAVVVATVATVLWIFLGASQKDFCTRWDTCLTVMPGQQPGMGLGYTGFGRDY